MAAEPKVLIVGTGTIGKSLTYLLTRHSPELGISQVLFHKRRALETDVGNVRWLVQQGARLCVNQEEMSKFERLGVSPSLTLEEGLEECSLVVDCTPAALENKKNYQNLRNKKGFIAQGSECGFGLPYAWGINDMALGAADSFIWVVSCNTHAMITVVASVKPFLKKADFVLLRRNADVTEAEKGGVISPCLESHKDAQFGSHHARDASLLFKTIGFEPRIFSSTVIIPTPLLHCFRFRLELSTNLSVEEFIERLRKYRVILTEKTLANTVFASGRDQGFMGRFLNPAIVSLPTLESRGKELVGLGFTPQEGNVLLSSVAAALYFLDPSCYPTKMRVFDRYLFEEV